LVSTVAARIRVMIGAHCAMIWIAAAGVGKVD
jgi:hypothetical protein